MSLNHLELGVEEYSQGQGNKCIAGLCHGGLVGGKKSMYLFKLLLFWFLMVVIYLTCTISFLLSFATEESDR
jgi:hypothetical protein